MKFRPVIFTIASLLIAIICTLIVTAANADEKNNDLIKKLVDGSPWEGRYGDYVTGTISFGFTLDKGKLRGELISVTGLSSEKVGPLSWLEVKDGKVAFTTNMGVMYELHLNDGKLIGTWIRRIRGWVNLSPKN